MNGPILNAENKELFLGNSKSSVLQFYFYLVQFWLVNHTYYFIFTNSLYVLG